MLQIVDFHLVVFNWKLIRIPICSDTCGESLESFSAVRVIFGAASRLANC